MLVTMFPNLSTAANIYLTIPVSTTSVEQNFSQMKVIKTNLRLKDHIGKNSLNHLMPLYSYRIIQ